MNFYYASINSGSNGNCYYLGNDNEGILIDVGIHVKEIEKRLKNLQIGVNKIKAVFVSHEHSDHIRGLNAFASKYNVPVYLSNATQKMLHLKIRNINFCTIVHNEKISIGELTVIPFSKKHDAADPFSFNVEYCGNTIGVYTDIGTICENVKTNFSKCQAVFLEANYDTAMLENGRYPFLLKQRIRGGEGHLSNMQALSLVKNHCNKNFKHIILAHLSAENNNHEIVSELFNSSGINAKIDIASRKKESKLFCFNENLSLSSDLNINVCQLELFDDSLN